MANIIKKKDNDKEYVFTCPVCGTVFTERERNIDTGMSFLNGNPLSHIVKCPNCGRQHEYFEKLEEYNKDKDYE